MLNLTYTLACCHAFFCRETEQTYDDVRASALSLYTTRMAPCDCTVARLATSGLVIELQCDGLSVGILIGSDPIRLRRERGVN